jgi:DnaA-homolog protein
MLMTSPACSVRCVNGSASHEPVMKQIPLPIVSAAQPDFDNFVAGANAAALAHARELVLPGAPLYLWGPPGSGKTHLLRALAWRCQQAGQSVGWFDATDPLPWVLAPHWTLLVFDRCDLMAPAAQHAAFTMFVDATTHGLQVAAAGRLPPVDLPLRDDLRTRLAWGHVFEMHTASDTDARAVLRREADRRGTFLPDDVLDHLLLHFPRDLGHLMQLIERLDDYAQSYQRRLTVPLLREMLHNERQDANAISKVAAE